MEKKLTVIETAELLCVSKEAIYNRIRRGSLESVVENGVKYIIITEDIKKSTQTRKVGNSVNDAYIQLLRDELQELKDKNRSLEMDKERLVKEKEKLLIESTEKVELIYKQRDEQLKNILALAARPVLEQKESAKQESEESGIDTIEIEINKDKDSIDETLESYDNWQDLRNYFKDKGHSKETDEEYEFEEKKL